MLATHQTKEQREIFKEAMRTSAEAMGGGANQGGGEGAGHAAEIGIQNGGANPQAAKDESILRVAKVSGYPPTHSLTAREAGSVAAARTVGGGLCV